MWAIFKRELSNYFTTKTSLIFAICFVFISNFLTFYIGKILDSDNASLLPFFAFHPWLYCFLLPAITSTMITDEVKKGSLEMLFYLPLSSFQIALGKFLAGWIFIGFCLISTFTIWITLNILATPDNLLILSSYIASFLIAGYFIAIGLTISSLAKSPTIAFILTTSANIAFLMITFIGSISFIQNILPEFLIEIIYSFDALPPYNNFIVGIVKAKDIIFFFSFIWLGIVISSILLERKK